jgi:hypothetical protein
MVSIASEHVKLSSRLASSAFLHGITEFFSLLSLALALALVGLDTLVARPATSSAINISHHGGYADLKIFSILFLKTGIVLEIGRFDGAWRGQCWRVVPW